MVSPTNSQIMALIKAQNRSEVFLDAYGAASPEHQAIKRIVDLLATCEFEASQLYSAPGRTELGGNHTDHNQGKVLCATVREDALAAVRKRSDHKVVIDSVGFDSQFSIDISDLKPRREERGNTNALIRGVLAGIAESGGNLGGFSARITSNVGVGSGLSSSASFEVLIGTILNDLYNSNAFSAEKIAMIGHFSENTYFGKPCGLMDQTASAVGGILKIDFADPNHLDLYKMGFNLETTDYRLVVVNTGSSHADLTPTYASIPAEMRLVANELGASQLGETSEETFLEKMPEIRSKLGDRPILRALHFFQENARVDQMVTALESDDISAFLAAVSASGASSQNILQNAIPPMSTGKEQGLAFALGVSQVFFEQRGRGVARVHGGGFAGTIQAYVHHADLAEYTARMESLFGEASLSRLHFRLNGARQILTLE